MNIKVAAYTVSEKSVYIVYLFLAKLLVGLLYVIVLSCAYPERFLQRGSNFAFFYLFCLFCEGIQRPSALANSYEMSPKD